MALHPDLNLCTLEDRILPVAEMGLAPSPFLAISSSSNAFVVPYTSPNISSSGANVGPSSTGGSVIAPGPSWYYLRIGTAPSTSIGGSTVGGTMSIYGLNTAAGMISVFGGSALNLNVGGGGGGGGNSGASNNAPGNAGGLSSFAGYGASFSSGYGTALSSANNYGMGSTAGAPITVGSVPVHSYAGGGDISDDATEIVDPDDIAGPGSTPNGGGAAPNLSPGHF